MGRSADERLTGDVARDLAQRVGAKAVLVGNIAPLGSSYVVNVNAVNAATGDGIAEDQEQASTKEKVLEAVGKAAANLRGKLGESLASVQKLDKPLTEATTASLDALKAFSEGEQARDTQGDAAALPYYKHAIELDPNFAMAYARVGAVQYNMGDVVSSRKSFTEAYQRRDRVSEHERVYIEARYYDGVVSNELKAIETYEEWKRLYPREWAPYNNLAVTYGQLGELEKGLENAQAALRLNSDVVLPYANTANQFVTLGRLDEAKATIATAHGRKLDAPDLHGILYAIAYLQNDPATMKRQLDFSAGTRSEPIAVDAEAQVAAGRGQLRRALELHQRAADLADRAGQRSMTANFLISAASDCALLGQPQQARSLLNKALAIDPGYLTQPISLYVAATAGDKATAERGLQRMAAEFPDSELKRDRDRADIQAMLESDPRKALADLEPARRFERSAPWVNYDRGNIYLKLKDGNSAAAEFQKVLAARTIDPLVSYHQLAVLGLARAYALAGDNTKARTAYQDFLGNWKDADPDLGPLKEAKMEYAKIAK
jgi:Tfp pilus assembly protein PilF